MHLHASNHLINSASRQLRVFTGARMHACVYVCMQMAQVEDEGLNTCACTSIHSHARLHKHKESVCRPSLCGCCYEASLGALSGVSSQESPPCMRACTSACMHACMHSIYTRRHQYIRYTKRIAHTKHHLHAPRCADACTSHAKSTPAVMREGLRASQLHAST